MGPLQPFWLDSVQYLPPTAAQERLAVVLQDVWVFLPERLPYNVTVVGLHPPPAAGHGHVLLLFVWSLRAFRDSFVSLDTENEEHK